MARESTAGSMSSSTGGVDGASKSPWFLTMHPGDLDVLIWKRGIRLKGKDGKGTGPVTRVTIENIEDGIIQVGILGNNNKVIDIQLLL